MVQREKSVTMVKTTEVHFVLMGLQFVSSVQQVAKLFRGKPVIVETV
jgi:hypothetical protein